MSDSTPPPPPSTAIIPADALPTSGALALPTAYDPSLDPAQVYVLFRYETPQSRQTAYGSLWRLARALGVERWQGFPWHHLTARETGLIRRRLLETPTLGPKTVTMTLGVLRGVLKQAFRMGLMTADEMQRAIDWAPVKAKRIPRGRALTAEEIGRLRAYVDRQVRPYRLLLDAMLFGAFLGAGLRREEVAGLAVDALRPGGLRVLGKGQKEREVWVPENVRARLQAWLDVSANVRLRCDSLFVRTTPSGAMRDRPLTPWAVWRLVADVCDDCGIDDIAPHDFRRTYASAMLEEVDIATVARQMGHSQITTTALYDRRGDRERGKAESVIGKLVK